MGICLLHLVYNFVFISLFYINFSYTLLLLLFYLSIYTFLLLIEISERAVSIFKNVKVQTARKVL